MLHFSLINRLKLTISRVEQHLAVHCATAIYKRFVRFVYSETKPKDAAVFSTKAAVISTSSVAVKNIKELTYPGFGECLAFVLLTCFTGSPSLNDVTLS